MKLWSAEAPETYCLCIEVVDQWGNVQSVEACQLAFRHDELKHGLLYHNGKPIMIRGVNRHEHEPLTGKVCSGQVDFF